VDSFSAADFLFILLIGALVWGILAMVTRAGKKDSGRKGSTKSRS